MNKIISIAILVTILTACSTRNNDQVLQEIGFKDGLLTEIHIGNISTEVHEVRLSELLENLVFVPLETKVECLISNTMIHFSADFIHVGTQNFPGTARLYRFNSDGIFINEIGKAGRGPGENEGYVIEAIDFCNSTGSTLAKWNGPGDKPQLYDINGELLFEIIQPGRFNNIYRWSEFVWFSTGTIADYPKNFRDSIALIFYNKEGQIINQIPRRSYPPVNARGYTPNAWKPSLYRFNGQSRLYLHGNDTIYNIIDMDLVPYAVLMPTSGALPFNSTINLEQLPGMYYFTIMAENEHNWYISKTIIKEAEVVEFQPGVWGGGYETENQYVIIDKKSKQAIRAKLIDDIFHMIPEEYLGPGLLEWQNNIVYFALPPYMLKELSENINIEIITNQAAKEVIEKVKHIPIDDNPVIFSFSLRERFEIPRR